MMTRKDYVQAAKIFGVAIADAKQQHGENSREGFFAIENTMLIAELFAEYFAQDNPNFDSEKFFGAIAKDN